MIAVSIGQGYFSPPKVIFLDVGQGDSMLFTNQTTQIIVDGSFNDLLVEKIHEYIPFYDREIDLVVATHAHFDHYGGLVRLLKEFEVKRMILPPYPCNPDPLFSVFKNIVEQEGVQILTYSGFSIGGVGIEVMNHERTDCVVKGENLNMTSVVTLFKYKGFSVLNMGDYEDDKEFEVDERIDVLKAGHHCSNTSSSLEFLQRVKPKTAICSLGENNYGHPSSEVLERFHGLGIKYFITKNESDVILNLSSGLIYNEAGKLLIKL